MIGRALDPIRRWRYQLWRCMHRWYYTEPGRHCLDTAQMRAIEADLAGRPWPAASAAPAPLTPAPGPELSPAETEAEPEADALRRAKYPRLYFRAEDYWPAQFRDLFIFIAEQTAADNALRIECGLGPRPLPPAPICLFATAA